MFNRKIHISVDKKEHLDITNKKSYKTLWQRFCDYFHLTPKIYLDLNNIPDNIIIQIGNKDIIFEKPRKEVVQIQPSSLDKFKCSTTNSKQDNSDTSSKQQFCIRQNGAIVPIESIKKFNINDIKI